MEIEGLPVHAFPARMVARVHKRPYIDSHTRNWSSKKLKTFVTNDKYKLIAKGFRKKKRVDKYRMNASLASSEQHIHGTYTTFIIETGAYVNLVGHKVYTS